MNHPRLCAPGVAAIVLLLMQPLPPIKANTGWAEGQVTTVESSKSEVRVELNPQMQEAAYHVETDACKITWTIYASDINRGAVTHRANCKTPLGDQTTLMSVLLKRVLVDHPEPDAFRGISWGRIASAFAGRTEMSLRLTLAAVQASTWDKRRGKPSRGHANHFAALLAEQRQIYAELADLFLRHGHGFLYIKYM